jgi:hypothetical protein
MKKRFRDKQHQTTQRLKVKAGETPAALNIDNAILDLVMKCLYEHPTKDELNLEEEIYKPMNIVLPRKVSERVWDSLKDSGMINPLIGFGKAGLIELTKAGTQIMKQYGSYNSYLHARQQASMPFRGLQQPSDHNQDQE